MEERGFEQYLEKAVSHISNKKKRKEIEEELAGHLEDKKELLMIKGFQEEDAKQKVLEEMGGAEELSRTLGILHSKVPTDEQGRLFVMLELGTGLSLISLNGWHLDTLMPTLGSLLLFWFFFRFRKVERRLEFGFYASIFFVLFQAIKNIVFSMPAIEPNYPNIQQWSGFIQNAYGALMVIFAFSGFQNLAAERKNFYMEERLRSAGCIYPLCYIGAFLGYGIFGMFLQRLDRTDPKLLQCFFFLIPLGVIIVLLRLRDIRNWVWEQEVLFELKKPEKFGGGILLMLLCGAVFVSAFFRAGISLQVPKEIQIELVSPKEEEHKRAQAVRQQLEQEVFWEGKEEVLNFIPDSEWLKCEGYLDMNYQYYQLDYKQYYALFFLLPSGHVQAMYVKNSLEKEGVSQGWGYRDGVYIRTSLERLSIEGEVLAFVRYMEKEKAHFLSPLAEYNSQQGYGFTYRTPSDGREFQVYMGMTIKEPDYTGLCSFEGLIGAQLPIQVISIHQTALFAGPVYGLQDFEESLERTGYDINHVYPQWNSLQTQTPF